MLNIKSPYRYIWLFCFFFWISARTARRFPDSLLKRTMDLVQGSGLRLRIPIRIQMLMLIPIPILATRQQRTFWQQGQSVGITFYFLGSTACEKGSCDSQRISVLKKALNPLISISK